MDPWASPWGDEVDDVPSGSLQRIDVKPVTPVIPLDHDVPWSGVTDQEKDGSLGGWGTQPGLERRSPVVQDSGGAAGHGLETVTEPLERIQLSKPDQIDLDSNLAHLATEAVTIESNVWGSGETLQDHIWDRNQPADDESDQPQRESSDSGENHRDDRPAGQFSQALDDRQVSGTRGKHLDDLPTKANYDASQSNVSASTSTEIHPSQTENTSAISKLGAVVSNWRRRPTDAPATAQPTQREPDPGWKRVAAPTASTTRRFGNWLGRNPQPDSQPQRKDTASPSAWSSWRRTPQSQSPAQSAPVSPKPKKETRKPPLPPAAALSEVDLSWLDKEITDTPPLNSALEVFNTYADHSPPNPTFISPSTRPSVPQIEHDSPMYQDEFSCRYEERYDATIDQPNQLFTDDEESDDQGASQPVNTHISQHPPSASIHQESDDWSEFLSCEPTKPKQTSTSNADDLWSVFETKPIHCAQAAQQANKLNLTNPTLQSKKPIRPLNPPPPPARVSSSESHRSTVRSSKGASLPSSNTPTPLASRVSSAQHSHQTKPGMGNPTTNANANTNSQDYLSRADLTFFESL
ncbi:hypothetical protein MYAM1_002856 [Malassezia yamatoensis]|uniref:Uncharacterized protein n=1 Tax=Malassezia yamatoensis TaxID=253288 RepID=A0AAJ6CHQ1_9BASI|nr:hypothetical protein MYAM1_002856 [Malassezia yamatoensis]